MVGVHLMTVGYIIYAMRCPTEIRRCGEPEDYVLEQFQLRNTVHLNSAAKECLAQFIFSPTENPKLQVASFHQEASEKLIPLQRSLRLTSLYHLTLCCSIEAAAFARRVSVTLLMLGCGIFLLPSVDVFFKVIRKIVFGG